GYGGWILSGCRLSSGYFNDVRSQLVYVPWHALGLFLLAFPVRHESIMPRRGRECENGKIQNASLPGCSQVFSTFLEEMAEHNQRVTCPTCNTSDEYAPCEFH